MYSLHPTGTERRHRQYARRPATMLVSLVACACGCAQAAGVPEVEQVLEFKPGSAKAKALFEKSPILRDLVQDNFDLAAVDLDGDGRKEILLRGASSSFCGSGGCLVVALAQEGNRITQLLSQNLPGRLAVTKSRFGRYRALVAVDETGKVLVGDRPGTALYGQPLVYPMAGASVRSEPERDRSTNPPSPLTSPSDAPGTAQMSKPALARLDVNGIQPGLSSLEQVRQRLRQIFPSEHIRESTLHLMGRDASGQGVVVDGSDQVMLIEARAPEVGTSCPAAVAGKPCEQMSVQMSHAVGGKVTWVRRTATFAPLPVDTFVAKLVEKYGEPGLKTGTAHYMDLRWSWAADGRALPLRARQPCALGLTAGGGRLDFLDGTAGELRRHGCVASVHVNFQISNQLVQRMEVTALDRQGLMDGADDANRRINEFVSAKDRRARERAQDSTGPRL